MAVDVGIDVAVDVGMDVGMDVGIDVGMDVGMDVGIDSGRQRSPPSPTDGGQNLREPCRGVRTPQMQAAPTPQDQSEDGI